jgi:uncharacterized protein
MIRNAIYLAMLALLPGGTVRAQEELTAAKKEDMKFIMEMTGVTKLADQMHGAMISAMTASFQKALPSIPAKAFAIIEEEVKAAFSEAITGPGGLLDMYYPIYHKYFTHAEIKEMIEFYKSPLGAKMIRVMPQLMHESMQAGMAWGSSLDPVIRARIDARLRKEGLLK